MHDTRINMSHTIRFRVIPLVATRKISTAWNSVSVNNLETEGFSFLFTENLGVGSFLDIKIDFQEIGHTTNCIGKIDRIEPSHPSSLFCITIKFKEMKRQKKEMIKNIVKEMVETEKQIPVKSPRVMNVARTLCTKLGFQSIMKMGYCFLNMKILTILGFHPR